MNIQILSVILILVFFATATPIAMAMSYQEKVDFASALEETLGHFIALEQNLNEGNSELAVVHATHPIAELYDVMKPVIQNADPALDDQIRMILIDLKDTASTDVSRADAQNAINNAREAVEIIRLMIIGPDLSSDPAFKASLMITLLETSIAEYGEAIDSGVIVEMAEFQDGNAFVIQSQNILDSIRDDIDSSITSELDSHYDELLDAYDSRADLTTVDSITSNIIKDLEVEFSLASQDTDLLDYVIEIQNLLMETKQAYNTGDKELALSLATKAYLDNYEFLELPLIELDERELMIEVEHMLREDLRNMIKNNAPASQVNTHIDAILEKMDTIAMIVPEFGAIAMLILVIAIISIIAITAKSRFGSNLMVKS